MCQVDLVASPSCHHSWLVLVCPCRPHRNLIRCNKFRDGHVSSGFHNFRASYWAWKHCCPKCDWYNMYDIRMIRMLKRDPMFGTRLRVGTF